MSKKQSLKALDELTGRETGRVLTEVVLLCCVGALQVLTRVCAVIHRTLGATFIWACSRPRIGATHSFCQTQKQSICFYSDRLLTILSFGP